MAEVTVDIECRECNAIGLLAPDRFGLAYICYACRGTGRRTYRYTPFTGRKAIAQTWVPGVSKVQWRNWCAGPPILYEAFLAGEMPVEAGES